jgi:hypothetical protein
MSKFAEEENDAPSEERRQVKNLLSENHRRALGTVLRRVELAAWRLEERIIREEPPQLALTHFTNPPTAAQRTALLRLTRRVRQEVAKLTADYQLEASEENLLRSTMAEFSLLWADLEDVRPQKLRSYGVLDPKVDTILGPDIERLIKPVLAVDSVASGRLDTTLVQQETEGSSMDGQD